MTRPLREPTPYEGPWERDDLAWKDTEGVQHIAIFGPDGPGHGRVAQAYAECGNDLLFTAALIEQAPNLLASLKEFLAYWSYERAGSTTFQDPDLLEMYADAHRAIRDAEKAEKILEVYKVNYDLDQKTEV